ncbi:MAG: hypothetical protein J5647_12830 [Spirochaetaceae bacterium]|nr:hypothetical protein [Spirochaetaceae bacterium]
MTLYEELQKVSSEEDVKDLYIKALKLKGYQKNLIDIQTKEIWFEAKVGSKISTYAMFTQLLFYVNKAIKDGEYIPPFLCVIDSVKAALMKTEVALPLLNDKNIKIKWGKSASEVTQDALDKVSQFIGTHFVSYNIQNNEKEFIEAVHNAIEHGDIIRTQITPDNLKQVFDKWVDAIGKEIKGVAKEDYALLFYADIMNDGTVSTHENLPAELLHRGTKPLFSLNGKLYEIGSVEGYRKFWAIYDRPPKEEYRNYLLERRDSLIPYDERSFKGAYYTPLRVVDKAYELLNKTLGNGWQKDYIVWDMCCGVGNLETKHSNPRNIYMSTLDQADIDVMKAAKTCVAAQRFQYDYLNDDITDNGEIDYSLTNKIPQGLQKIIEDAKNGKKKILVLINPPYAEATNADNTAKDSKKENKAGVAKTKWAAVGMNEYGRASNELFLQFVTRVAKELPNATIAMFSKLKHINAQTTEKFRQVWKAKYLGGFIVHSKAFDGLKGEFPIGFLIWKTNQNELFKFPAEISCEIHDKNANPIGEKKFYSYSENEYLSNWIERPKTNEQECVPLTNAVTPPEGSRKDQRGTKWSDGAIAYMCTSPDFQHLKYIFLLSSGASMGHGIFVNEENLWQCAILFTVEKMQVPTWLNDRDQFLQPNELFKSDGVTVQEFKDDCLIWMLFNGANLSASADDLEWNGKKWSIVNHFIPFTEAEVNAPDRFESDFMIQYMADKQFSKEATDVLEQGKIIWKKFFETDFNHAIRDEFKLNRADVGWYQIRQAIKKYNEDGEHIPIKFDEFERAYSVLSDKLRPQVYEYGFLK